MNNKLDPKDSYREKYVEEFLSALSDAVHKRLIQAYQGNDPVESMESELGKILIEALHRED